MLILFPDVKGPRRKDSRLKKREKPLPSVTFFRFFLFFFRQKYCQNQMLLPNTFALKYHSLVKNFCQNVMTNSIQQLLLPWRSYQGYKYSIRNNIFSAKLLFAYPAKELLKSFLPRAFTCKEGGVGQPEVEIATLFRKVASS